VQEAQSGWWRQVLPQASVFRKSEADGRRWPLADELIDGTLTGTNGAQGSALSAMILGDIRHGKRLFVDIHADEECVRL
jgi:hypothetical protein